MMLLLSAFLPCVFIPNSNAEIVTSGMLYEQITSPSSNSPTESTLTNLFTPSFHSCSSKDDCNFVIKDTVSGMISFKASENELPTDKSNLQIWKKFSPESCSSLKKSGHKSGFYIILLRSGWFQVFCEMDFNGGGYTFFTKDSLPRLSQKDIDALFTDKSNVLLRLLKPDGSQPYTIIEQYKDTGGLSVQLNGFENYTEPINSATGTYLFLGLQRKVDVRSGVTSGFKTNGIDITFLVCDNIGNSYFTFYSTEVRKYNIILSCDATKIDTQWRGSAINSRVSPKMLINYFMSTEIHFGGCGCYMESHLWPSRENPALGCAIGMR